MIDSHAHLIWDSYEDDIKDVIKSALSKGVSKFIHPCVELKEFSQMKALRDSLNAEFGEIIYLAAGVHPCHANTWLKSQESFTEELKNLRPEIIAIGETGLDSYHQDVSLDVQVMSFTEHVLLAEELDLPLIVHCRDCFEETLEILSEKNNESNKRKRGVMHCYTGNARYSQAFWELGFFTSFSGCLTFKNASALREEAKRIPLERVLIETDSPFLAPQNNRGKRNEPAFLPEVAEVLAQIHDKTINYIDGITSENTERLFEI